MSWRWPCAECKQVFGRNNYACLFRFDWLFIGDGAVCESTCSAEPRRILCIWFWADVCVCGRTTGVQCARVSNQSICVQVVFGPANQLSTHHHYFQLNLMADERPFWISRFLPNICKFFADRNSTNKKQWRFRQLMREGGTRVDLYPTAFYPLFLWISLSLPLLPILANFLT